MINNINSIIAATMNEANSSIITNINDSDIKKILTSNDYMTAFNNDCLGYRIFRGVNSDYSNAAIITPGIRISQNTHNIYTRLISDILPSWKEYPKRNRSFVCSTSINTAMDYAENGFLYVIFPKNDSKIGICSESDIWYSFGYLCSQLDIIDLSQFNDLVLYMIFKIYYRQDSNELLQLTHGIDSKNNKIVKKEIYTNIKKIFNLGSTNKIIDLFNNITNILNDNYDEFNSLYNDTEYSNKLIAYILKQKNINVLDIIANLLDPNNNKIKYTTVRNFNTKHIKNREVWIEGECLFVEYNYMRNHI